MPNDEPIPPPLPRQDLIEPPHYQPPTVQQHYHAPPQAVPVFIQTAPQQHPRLEAGGWFARAFASTTGIVLAILFFLVVVPGAVMILACGGCAYLAGNAVDQVAKEVDKEEKRLAAKRPQRKAAPAFVPAIIPVDVEPLAPGRTFPEPEKRMSKEEVDALAEEARRQREQDRLKKIKLAANADRILRASRTRTWQSPSGAFKLEAEFVRYSEGKVTLRKADGSELEVEIAKLSVEDRDWIEARRK